MKKLCLILSLLLLAATTWAGELRCLRPGAPVISLYRDNRYFPGRVDGLGESIDVTFENGLQQTYSSFTNDVIVDDIPDPGELAGGSRVLARRPSSTSFEPGFVNGSIEGLPLNDTYLVNYDTGDSIARNIGDIRLAVKPRSCMNEKGIYIGCFENVVNNFLTNYYPVNPTDVATCNWACFTRGFRFAGLQNGTWCFCGNHVNDSLKVDDNDCNIACRDSREDVCGGYQRMTVYWTGVDYSDNNTNDLSEFADAASQLPSDQDALKSETSTERECSDLHDSTQCNAWADQSKCIENPDWMLVNCKKSCYACSYDEHSQERSQDKATSSPQTYTPVSSAQPQSQVNPYQSSSQTGYQASSSYPQSPYQDTSTQSSSKKSDHPVLDSTNNIPGYLGCFKDSPSSHDLEYLADIRPLSIRACVTKCKSMRFPYAGVQSTTLCYCGLHYGKYGQLEHEDCNTPCEADASEMCGGIFKNSLYHTGFPIKFKSSETALTRKNLASPASAVERPFTANNMAAYSPNPNYQSQYPQSSYPQPNPSYNPPIYPQPSSPYTQAAMPFQPGYPQAPTSQTNAYQPVYSYSPQVSNPLQAGGTSTANADTRDYSPRDSSAYRWRETYVKLRQQEQERYSKPTHGNLRRILGKESTWSEIPVNSFREHQRKAKDRGSSKFQNLGNSAKQLPSKESQTHSMKFTDTLASQNHSPGKSLYKHLISQVYKNSRASNSHGNKRILQKGARRHNNLGKPGVFLRKKASNKSSFLAFLPHEVTEDESLLENVYNMLSVMLKNLRKHKKSSMKTLRKYLKLSSSEEDLSKFTRKVPIHNSEGQKSKHHSEKSFERKSQGLGVKDSRSSQQFETAKKHHSEGQKQLSKQRKEISNSQRYGAQTMTVISHDVPRVEPDINQSFTHKKSAASRQSANETRSTQVQTHDDDTGELNQSQTSKYAPGNTPQLQTTFASTLKQPRGHALSLELDRNKSGVVANEYQKPMVDESKSENNRPWSAVDKKTPVEYNSLNKSSQVSGRKYMLRVQANTRRNNGQQPSKFVKIGNTFDNMKEKNSFKSEETRNVSLDNREEKLLKNVPLKQNYSGEGLEKLSKQNSPSSKAEGRTSMKLNTSLAKSKTDGENIVEKSADDIISTIVDLLDREKALRSMKDQKKLRKRNESKRNKRKRKRRNKKHQKRKRKVENKERRHKIRTHGDSKHGKQKSSESKMIYKKDHLGKVNEIDNENNDENLMEQEEDFQENNKMNEW